MGKYIRLVETCGYVEGENGAMLLDLKNKKAYHIEMEESKALKQLLEGKNIQESVGNNKKLQEFVSQLIKKKLGKEEDTWRPSEKIHKGSLYELHPELRINMNNIFVELPGDCYENCELCGENQINGCFSCKIASDKVEYNKNFYYRLLSEITNYNFRNIFLYGGNLFLNEDIIIDILEYTKRLLVAKEARIFLICRDKHISKKVTPILKKFNVIPIVGFDCRENASKDFWESFQKTLDIIGENMWCVNLQMSSKTIKNFLPLKLILLEKYNIQDVVVTMSLHKNDEKIEYFSLLPKLTCDETSFSIIEKIHPCLAGTLAISATGEVFPCPCIKEKIGCINCKRGATFSRIFDNKEKIMNFWGYSVEKIESCKRCEYRKTCSDCRAYDFNCGDLDTKRICAKS